MNEGAISGGTLLKGQRIKSVASTGVIIEGLSSKRLLRGCRGHSECVIKVVNGEGQKAVGAAVGYSIYVQESRGMVVDKF